MDTRIHTCRVITDHPAWWPTASGYRRVFADGDNIWQVEYDDGPMVRVVRGGNAPLVCDHYLMPHTLPNAPQLVAQLRTVGTVARFANPDLWDAVATAILRQVIRAGQARKLHRTFTTAFGEPLGDGRWVFPEPVKVASLTDDQLRSVGIGFHGKALRAAAAAYMADGSRWRHMDAAELTTVLQAVPRIGPWTARAAVADWSNDFTHYPYYDLAVRTWARRAAPDHPWPTDETDFGRYWRDLCGPHLSTITLLTLAWGIHHGAATT